MVISIHWPTTGDLLWWSHWSLRSEVIGPRPDNPWFLTFFDHPKPLDTRIFFNHPTGWVSCKKNCNQFRWRVSQLSHLHIFGQFQLGLWQVLIGIFWQSSEEFCQHFLRFGATTGYRLTGKVTFQRFKSSTHSLRPERRAEFDAAAYNLEKKPSAHLFSPFLFMASNIQTWQRYNWWQEQKHRWILPQSFRGSEMATVQVLCCGIIRCWIRHVTLQLLCVLRSAMDEGNATMLPLL